MFTERFFVEGLAHASYLFGENGAAAVVDPKRDVDDYITAAERHGAKIVAIFETHPHADFVSGHVELARRTGAAIYVSEKVDAAYPHRKLTHGDVVPVGSLRVRALDTPGHSPDSMSYYVASGQKRVVYTGDILFVGDVGRPDLRDATADPRSMADALYDTLHEVLFTLPKDTIVYPAHGAGSLCGRKIGTAPETTIGAEKETNWANRYPDREAFVQAMLANLPDRPAYFAFDVAQNLKGAAPLATLARPEPLPASALRELSPDVLVLDTRGGEAFGAAHIAGSLNVGIGSAMFSTWTGFFVTPGTRIILVVDTPEAAEKAWLELVRIGYDTVIGYVPADAAAWREAKLDVRTTPQMDVCDIKAWLGDGSAVLDVRTPGEWEEGHVEGARWIPLPQLPGRLSELPAVPLATMCGSGYRSSLTASLLERAGVRDVVNVRGGWSAWTTRPCLEPDARDLFHGEKATAQ
jgi:glyoxylase-like metal-dependent hydrolase (beta-lactamase superfamily II)/rhodanese-related sulfurtransferase